MKRLMSAALALALLSGTAASADPWGGRHMRYDHGWRHHRHHDNDAGTAIAVGVGLLALTAIIASADRDRDRARAYADVPPPPPPPPPGYRYGPDNDAYPQDGDRDYGRYDRGQDQNYRDEGPRDRD